MKSFLNRFSPLIFILVLAAFFRLYRLGSLLFWSVDDEIFWAVVKRMADLQTLTLVSPNGTLGVSLGSFFHILSLPVYIFSASPDKMLVWGAALGIITTGLVYLAGKEFGGKKVGFLAALFYSGSFVTSLADRRWWPLTPDSFFAALSLLSAAKVARGQLSFLLPLVVAASFAWHADPSLAVLVLGSAVTMFVFRSKIFAQKKFLILPSFYLLASTLPLVLFERRHPGSISSPLVNLLGHLAGGKVAVQFPLADLAAAFLATWQHLTMALFPSATTFAELYFHCQDCPAPFLYPLTTIILLGITLFVLTQVLRAKDRAFLIPFFYLGAFFLGVLLYKQLLRASIYESYSLVVLPIFFVVVAYGLVKLKTAFLIAFVATFLFTNVNALLNSRMRYPLADKLEAVDNVIDRINSKKVSLTVVAGGQYFQGYASLFLFRGVCPVNKDYYAPWDWYYRAYSLYGCPLEEKTSSPRAIFFPADAPAEFKSDILVNNIGVSIQVEK